MKWEFLQYDSAPCWKKRKRKLCNIGGFCLTGKIVTIVWFEYDRFEADSWHVCIDCIPRRKGFWKFENNLHQLLQTCSPTGAQSMLLCCRCYNNVWIIILTFSYCWSNISFLICPAVSMHGLLCYFLVLILCAEQLSQLICKCWMFLLCCINFGICYPLLHVVTLIVCSYQMIYNSCKNN